MSEESSKAVFLDRDGVINEVMSARVRHVNSPENFYFLPGAKEGIKMLHDAGFLIFAVTNQGGVGLGYLKKKVLDSIHRKMEKEIEKAGGKLTEIKACCHSPHAGCSCRKPEPQLIHELLDKYRLDPKKCFMAGDRETDIEAGQKAGTRTILIGSGETKAERSFPSLLKAAEWIVKETSL